MPTKTRRTPVAPVPGFCSVGRSGAPADGSSIHQTTEPHTAHQLCPTEVTIYYRFHPLRTHSLPVVRLYELDDEAYYVVRRADGRPLAVPVWMTHPESAHAKIVSTARLPVRVLLELHRVAVTCLSSSVHNVPEEDYDAAAPSKTPTTDVRRSSHRSRCTTPIGRADIPQFSGFGHSVAPSGPEMN